MTDKHPVSIDEHPAPSSNRSGILALVGRANVGKSTLVNALLEEKISIVSPVAQTTRNRIRGILTDPRGQLVFLDTPGVHKARHELGRVMNKMARASIEGVDVVLLVFDASIPPALEDEGWTQRLMRETTPCVAILNKVDRGAGHAQSYRDLWAESAQQLCPERTAEWVTISAQEGTGVEALRDSLFERMPEGPLLFPEDVLTDFPRKLAMADVIREKLFSDLRDELPHSVAVLVDSIDETDTGWTVHAIVYVQKYSQKGIVIGEKGRRLRRTRRSATRELSEIYGHEIDLDLWVKVEKSWQKNFWFLKKLGYVE